MATTSSSPSIPLCIGSLGPRSSSGVAVLKEVKVKVGAWVSKGQVVAVVEKREGEEGTTTTTTIARVKAESAGKVVEICKKVSQEVDERTILCLVTAECSHPTLMKDMCADCGADLRQDEGGGGGYKRGAAAETGKANIAMVHSIPELRVNSDEAQALGMEDEIRLRKHKKLVLLVDLDQTLIHTTNENIDPNIKGVYHFRLYGPTSPWYHTRIRPFTTQFMERISKLYELHICTFGARLYAHTVAGFLDPKGKYFSQRILSRDECFDSRSKTANLSSLFPCGDHMVCIIDDREDVWKFAPNLVHVKPYNFFKNTGDINAPPGSPSEIAKDNSPQDAEMAPDEPTSVKKEEEESKKSTAKEEEDKEKKPDGSQQVSDDLNLSDDEGSDSENNEDRAKEGTSDAAEEAVEDDLVEVEDNDDYLIYLEEILKTIHTAYYEMYDQMQTGEKGDDETPDLKTVIPYVKRKTLQGSNVVFSGVVPTHVPLKKSRAYMVARSLGANVAEKLSYGPTDKTTHLIAARLGTAKINEAKRAGGIRIVTPDWLWCCAERWEKIDERLFPLCKQSHVTLKPPAHCSSPDIAFAERCDASLNLNLPEANNPMLSFSSEELKGMGDEIDDILSEDSSSSSSSEGGGAAGNSSFPPKLESGAESSSEDSLTAEEPKGWGKEVKRKKLEEKEEEDDEDEDEDEDEDDDEIATMAEELENWMDEDSNAA